MGYKLANGWIKKLEFLHPTTENFFFFLESSWNSQLMPEVVRSLPLWHTRRSDALNGQQIAANVHHIMRLAYVIVQLLVISHVILPFIHGLL